MKRSVIKRLVRKHLLPSLPGFESSDWMLYRVPVHDLLVACLFEPSSGDAASFAVNAFVQPLYVPDTQVHMTFGRRLSAGGGKRWWDYSRESEPEVMRALLRAMTDEALPFLNHFREAADFVIHGRGLVSTHDNPVFLEAYAYSALRAGMTGDGLNALGALEAVLNDMDETLGYVQQMAQRASRLRAAATVGESQVQALLTEWRNSTRDALGLNRSGVSGGSAT